MFYIDKDKKFLECISGFVKILGLREKSIDYPLNKFLSRYSEAILLPDRALNVIDIDYFKRINDTYCHKVGDYVLKNFNKIIGKSIRHEDIFARFGGEEFILLLPNTKKDSAFEVSERIRQK